MSLGFVGRLYSSMVGFYNEINSATLTGAIDVVIVKQEDGSYHSSPFHVRFGKLGVLRSREKIVDIVINGQPVGLHMKLGEAGEAFFVQEIEDEGEMEFPAYLATSPILSSEELMKEGVERLRLESQKQDRLEQQRQQQEQQQPAIQEEGTLRTLSALAKDLKSDSSIEDDKRKGKPRRKVLTKRKQKHSSASRSSPRSQSMPEGLVGLDQEQIFDMEVTESTSEDEEVMSYSLGASRSVSLELKKEGQGLGRLEDLGELPLTPERRLNSMETFLTPLSEPEMSPLQSPMPTRPPSPKSDTEVDRQHAEEKQQELLHNSTATWEWGEFPKQAPNVSDLDSSITKEQINSMIERQDSEKVSSGGLLSLWAGASSKQKKKTSASQPLVSTPKKDNPVVEEKGIYLDDLAHMEDPEIAKLYLGSPRFQSIRERERDDDTESGRGASLPQSPHSVDGAIGGPVSFLESEVRHLGTVSLSLCGGLSDPEGMTLDKFMKKVVTFDDLVDQPTLMSNPDLVVKIRDGYYNWVTASPMVLSEMVFNKQLPEDTVSGLVKKHMPKKLKKKGSWWLWRSSTNQNAGGGVSEDPNLPTSTHQTSVVIPVLKTSDADGMSSKFSESSLSPIISPATSPPTSVHGTPRKSKRDRNPSEHLSTETDTDHSEKESSSSSPHPHHHRRHRTPPPSPVITHPHPHSLSHSTTATTQSEFIVSEPAVDFLLQTETGVDQVDVSENSTVTATTATITAPTMASTNTVHFMTDVSTSTIFPGPTVHVTADVPKAPDTVINVTAEILKDPTVIGKEAVPAAAPEIAKEPVAAQTKPLSVEVPDWPEVEEGRKGKKEKYIKTLRLNSEQIAKLNLREGTNEVEFSVTTQYQGTTRCVSHIYLWNYDDKIVISDIDGTITKSDVMGQILPLIGRDWSQSGVAQLFTRLSHNGYKLLYLSARAIGQSKTTKDLLRSIRQGELVLPDGPLLLNPTSLISAFHREVIVRNPEEFKISCLKDIAQLFPSMPFYAGFGNKINDVIAYRALTIPNFRIFTINPQGQLRHDLSHTFLSSYSKMSDVADHFFPPIDPSNRSVSNAFSNVNYWRQPPVIVDPVDIASLKTVDETPAKTYRKLSLGKSDDEGTATTNTTTTTVSVKVNIGGDPKKS